MDHLAQKDQKFPEWKLEKSRNRTKTQRRTKVRTKKITKNENHKNYTQMRPKWPKIGSNAKSTIIGPKDPKKVKKCTGENSGDWESVQRRNVGFRSKLRIEPKMESKKTTNENTRHDPKSGLTCKAMKKAHEVQKGLNMLGPKFAKQRKRKKT